MRLYRSHLKVLRRKDPLLGDSNFLDHFDVFAIQYISVTSVLWSVFLLVLYRERMNDIRPNFLLLAVFGSTRGKRNILRLFEFSSSRIQGFELLELRISCLLKLILVSLKRIPILFELVLKTTTYEIGRKLSISFVPKNEESTTQFGYLSKWMSESSIMFRFLSQPLLDFHLDLKPRRNGQYLFPFLMVLRLAGWSVFQNYAILRFLVTNCFLNFHLALLLNV